MALSVPELDYDQAALGQWVEHKSPRGVYSRRWLAEVIKRIRAAGSRRDAIEIRQELLAVIFRLESDALELRKRMRRDLERMPHIGPELVAALDGGATHLEVLQAIDGLATALKDDLQ